MSTERLSLGFNSLIPENYKTQAEAFAKCLHHKLLSLRGIEKSPPKDPSASFASGSVIRKRITEEGDEQEEEEEEDVGPSADSVKAHLRPSIGGESSSLPWQERRTNEESDEDEFHSHSESENGDFSDRRKSTTDPRPVTGGMKKLTSTSSEDSMMESWSSCLDFADFEKFDSEADESGQRSSKSQVSNGNRNRQDKSRMGGSLGNGGRRPEERDTEGGKTSEDPKENVDLESHLTECLLLDDDDSEDEEEMPSSRRIRRQSPFPARSEIRPSVPRRRPQTTWRRKTEAQPSTGEEVDEEVNEKDGDKQLGSLVSEEKQLSAVDSDEKQLGAIDSDEKQLGAVDSEDKQLGAIDGAIDSGDKQLGAADSEDKQLGALDSEDKQLSTRDSEDKQLGAIDSEDKQLSTRDLEDKPLGSSIPPDFKELAQDGPKQSGHLNVHCQVSRAEGNQEEEVLECHISLDEFPRRSSDRDSNDTRSHPAGEKIQGDSEEINAQDVSDCGLIVEIDDPCEDGHSSDEDRIARIAQSTRLQRSSSLKTWKTPPGTPGGKKIVRFADALGLDLADVRTFLDEVPKVPSSAYSDLHFDFNYGAPAVETQSLSPAMTLVPAFQQPGLKMDFYERVQRQRICLEMVSVTDSSILSVNGYVRVQNIGYQKSVFVRYTFNNWETYSDLQATYVPNSCDGFSDKFSFVLYGHTLKEGDKLEFAVRLNCCGNQYWDNNGGLNYVFHCLPQSNPNRFFSSVYGSHLDPCFDFY